MSQMGVCLFYSNSMALRAEKVLKTAGFAVKLIPTPRQLSSDCGIALQFNWQEQAPIQKLLRRSGVEVAQVCPLPD
jgi:hypothetical protein